VFCQSLSFLLHTAPAAIHTIQRGSGHLFSRTVLFSVSGNASLFFITATTLAWGGWQMSFRRVPEAIGACVPVIGVIAY
jgi:hypothetical protein